MSRSMWDGRVTRGMTRQELAVLKAPLVYAEIMSFIKVRTGTGVLGVELLLPASRGIIDCTWCCCSSGAGLC